MSARLFAKPKRERSMDARTDITNPAVALLDSSSHQIKPTTAKSLSISPKPMDLGRRFLRWASSHRAGSDQEGNARDSRTSHQEEGSAPVPSNQDASEFMDCDENAESFKEETIRKEDIALKADTNVDGGIDPKEAAKDEVQPVEDSVMQDAVETHSENQDASSESNIPGLGRSKPNPMVQGNPTQDTDSDEAFMAKMDAKFPNARKQTEKLLHLVAMSDETANKTPSFFTKTYKQIDLDQTNQDWSENHYLKGDDKKDADKDSVLLTSYGVEYLESKLPAVDAMVRRPFMVGSVAPDTGSITGATKAESGSWLTIDRTPFPSKQPEVPDDDFFPKQLKHMTQLEHLQCCKGLPVLAGDMLATFCKQLKYSDVAEDILSMTNDETRKKTKQFLLSSLQYSLGQQITPLFQKLFKLAGTPESKHSEFVAKNVEVCFGFGHVRMLCEDSNSGCKVINGALFDVLMDVQVQTIGFGTKSTMVVTVSPVPDADVSLNLEVLGALVAAGNVNKEFLQELCGMAENTDASTLVPGKLETYRHLLDKAQTLQCNSQIRLVSDDNAHVPPEDSNSMILTDGWCLYTRKRLDNWHSRHARSILKALQSGTFKMKRPLYELLEGSGTTGGASLCRAFSQDELDRLVYPLPSSTAQQEVGCRLLIDNAGITILDGPPGTGKTQTIVNIVASALARGKSVLVFSSNDVALRAFFNKLPEKLRALCMAVFAFEKRPDELLKVVGQMDLMLSDVLKGKATYEKKIQSLEAEIERAKLRCQAIDQCDQNQREESRQLLSKEKVRRILDLTTSIGRKFSWAAAAFLSDDTTKHAFVRQLNRYCQDYASHKHIALGSVDGKIQDLIDLVQMQQVDGSSASPLLPPHLREDPPSEAEAMLDQITIDERSPETKEDWASIQKALEWRQQFVLPIVEANFAESDIFDNNGSICNDFLAMASKVDQIGMLLDELGPDVRGQFVARLKSCSCSLEPQDERLKLISKIQHLQAELVSTKAILTISDKMTQKSRGKLVDLASVLRDASGKAFSDSQQKLLNAKNIDEKSLSQNMQMKKALSELVKVLPLVAMTTQQTSIFLSPDSTYDIGINDEASQSGCTALLPGMHCRQLLIVGDDKQSSEKQQNMSDDRLSVLRARLPSFASSEKLLPGSSSMDQFKVACPSNSIFLSEQFRGPPEVVQPSNELFYFGRLIPVKLPSKEAALIDKPVYGEKAKNGVNQEECDEAARIFRKYATRRAKCGMKVETFMFISLGGLRQIRALEKSINVVLNELLEQYGHVISQDDLLFGEPSQIIGNEADNIILSLVDDKNSVRCQSSPDDRKEHNVALTRTKKRMFVLRSFDVSDIEQACDIRKQYIPYFKFANEMKGSGAKSTTSCNTCLAQSLLISELERLGYVVSVKDGGIWAKSLCVWGNDVESSGALLMLENAGEEQDVWEKIHEEQTSLERAGVSCIRVDFFALTSNFQGTLDAVVGFLKKAGVHGKPTVPQEIVPNLTEGARIPVPVVTDPSSHSESSLSASVISSRSGRGRFEESEGEDIKPKAKERATARAVATKRKSTATSAPSDSKVEDSKKEETRTRKKRKRASKKGTTVKKENTAKKGSTNTKKATGGRAKKG
ncbi:Inherit from COG: Helicase [Seminavis robusta]|uniref:Inherit from COG: Helicase n=1 Tax=Seminavis robusta TaxID=568900 RepID=A0A9N8EJ19_9STRA|nr:Inherit from COG: Helicase [Seminavis robusta]|eukprot:Sro1035_g233930.1 Inherit from COG: Helicase (1613) ;mRNA; r:24284-29298